MTAYNAMGSEGGDYLTLANKWATVDIVRETSDTYCNDGRYYVTGEPECSRNGFRYLRDAVAEAWRVLALYQQGRAD